MPGELFFVDSWTYIKVTHKESGKSFYYTVRTLAELKGRMFCDNRILNGDYRIEQVDLNQLELASIMKNLNTETILMLCSRLEKGTNDIL